jgi:hypothetical protein
MSKGDVIQWTWSRLLKKLFESQRGPIVDSFGDNSEQKKKALLGFHNYRGDQWQCQ